MKIGRCLLVALLLGAPSFPLLAQVVVKVGVITSASGPAATVGMPQKNTVPLLPRRIGDLTVEYTHYDDASDPAQTVQLAKTLLTEHKVDALIGPSASPNAIAVLPLVAEAKTPLLAPVGSGALVQPMDEQKRWVFKTTQNESLIAEMLVAHMKKTGVRTAGFIGVDDAYGEGWHREFSSQATRAGIQLVASERYQRGDTAVARQVAKLVAARPDAVLVAGAGAPSILPHTTLADQGYKGRIYQTHGAAMPEFARLGGKKVDGALMAASLMPVLREVADTHPSKQVALGYIGAYEKLHGAKPATFGANLFDAGMLLQKAIPEAARKARPGSVEFREALRDALEKTRELVATQGVYTMTPQDHSGFDQRGRVMMRLQDGMWRLLKD